MANPKFLQSLKKCKTFYFQHIAVTNTMEIFEVTFDNLYLKPYRAVLKQVGEDPNREGLLDTPMRAAKAMMFFTKGYTETVQEVVKVMEGLRLSTVLTQLCRTPSSPRRLTRWSW